ncbi:MAG: hypothetical protein LC725_07640 [Lentisphaerae bacterium]|nr:hypothetical protein [Lentisphaerota bacterium]
MTWAPASAQRYVAQGTNVPDGVFESWATAASNIQDAVEVALHGDTIWIDSGRYTASATPSFYEGSNVVYANDKALTFRGRSGDPADVIIDGEGKCRGFAAVRTSAGTLGFMFASAVRAAANGMSGAALAAIGAMMRAYASAGMFTHSAPGSGADTHGGAEFVRIPGGRAWSGIRENSGGACMESRNVHTFRSGELQMKTG